MFFVCCMLLYVHSSFAIILIGKRELVAFLSLSSWCLVIVVRLFLEVPWVCLQFVIVVFPDHTQYFLPMQVSWKVSNTFSTSYTMSYIRLREFKLVIRSFSHEFKLFIKPALYLQKLHARFEINRNCLGQFHGIKPRMYIKDLLWYCDPDITYIFYWINYNFIYSVDKMFGLSKYFIFLKNNRTGPTCNSTIFPYASSS